MKLSSALFGILSIATSAFSAEQALGGEYKVVGTIGQVYIRQADVFIINVKDPSDGTVYQAWMKGNNNYALATLLSEKAAGHNVRIIYHHMPNITDRDDNCWDVPYVTWVCNQLLWVEAIE